MAQELERLFICDKCGYEDTYDVEGNELECPHCQDGTLRAKPDCTLIGEDGNVFLIMGRVQRALKDAGLKEKAKEFMEKATSAKSYDEVLGMLHEYVNVK